jgi:mono/diheme cytochrome c family protein
MKSIAGVLIAIAVLGLATSAFAVRPRLPAAERGRRLAEKTGCFGCHGPGGLRGASNPGRVDKTVPSFEEDLMMYAKTPEEIREWIRDGVTRKKADSQTWRAERDRGALRMPAFGRRLGERQIEDLSAYVMAVSGMAKPPDSLAAHGLERAEALGCFGCHGPGGRLARANPGSLKGYVPSWDGEDFPELVASRMEFEQWVEQGVARRLERNPIARTFLRRAALHMPRYERHLEEGDLEALRAYVEWLRGRALPPGDGRQAEAAR